MPKVFAEAVSELVVIASYIRSLPDPSKNLWSMVIDNLNPSGSINQAFRTPVAQMIEHYVRKQYAEDKQSVCLKMGTWMVDETHGEDVPIVQSIERGLELRLFEAFIEQARQSSTRSHFPAE